MNVPAELRAVLRSLSRQGRPYLVGGCVRDFVLGLEPDDYDVEVYGLSWEAVATILQPFGPTDVVGKSFGVIKLRLGGVEYDISLPRVERKMAEGHRGFAVAPDAKLDEATASARRDFTLNALLYDPQTDRIVDHHGGLDDLRERRLRHTGPAFTEDPLRVLRAFQLAARFDLTLDPATAALCRSMAHTFTELPRERIWGEWQKFAAAATRPSRGLEALQESGWLPHFPELAALDGLPQEPEWHPEGDVITHVGCCLDALATLSAWRSADAFTRQMLSLAVLAHDFGKAGTTTRAERKGVERWVSPGHDRAGGGLSDAFLERIGAPRDIRARVRPLVECHHAHLSWPESGPSNAAVRRLARKLAPATIDDLLVVLEADHRGRPPLLSAATARRIEDLRTAAAGLAVQNAAPVQILHGRDLIALGLSPGPEFSEILAHAYEAQLDGAFADHPAGMNWLRSRIAPRSSPTSIDTLND